MQSADTEHVVGRRFDSNDRSNLVLFRGADPKIGNVSPKGEGQDMLDYVRAQEQKLKLEKLKWHENATRVAALHPKPTKTNPNKPTKAPNVIKPIRKATEPALEPKTVAKTRVSPKNVADLIEDRTKRASQWLHQEQKEFAAKKLEIAEHKKAAKELDKKIRALQQQEAEQRRQKQLRLLYEDPTVQVTLPGSVAVEVAASAQTFVPRASQPSSVAGAISSNTAPAPFMPASDVRISYDTMVIQQVASQLQLPEHPDNDLLLMHKRPRVPLLSKSYVNKSNLVHVGTHPEETHGLAASIEPSTATLVLTKRTRVAPKPSGDSDNESDGYGDDEDFEATDNNNAPTGALLDAALVQKVLHNERYSTPHNRVHSDGESDGDSDGESTNHVRSSEVDEITKKSEMQSQKRRELGKEFAARKRHEVYQNERKERQAKALQEEKRKQALANLQTHVVSINKRTKHTLSGAGPSGNTSSTGTRTVQSTSNITSVVSTPAGALPGLMTFEERPEEDDEANRPALASIKEYVMNKYDFLPRQLLSADDVDSVNYNDGNSEYVDSAPNSRPQSRLVETPCVDDLRNLDPREAGGWKQFLAQERRIYRAAEQDSANRERARESSRETKEGNEHRGNKDKTPPRTRPSNGPLSAPSSSQSHTLRRASPQSARPERTSPATSATLHANAALTAMQARRPTPPPFRFNSWQAPTAASANKRLSSDRTSGTGMQTRTTTGGQIPSRSSSAGRSRPQSGPSSKHTAKKTKFISPPDQKKAQRKSLPPRSTSAGSTGMARRRSQGETLPKTRYTKPVPRSRSVLHQGSREEPPHQHARGGDTLDLFDRYHSSDDEPNFHDEAPEYEDYPGYADQDEFEQHHYPDEPVQDAPAHNGLGGYLSRSPARGLLPEADQYRSQHDVEAALHVPRIDGIAARSLEEAQLMQDVSFQAIKNFEQVTRVLQDVDRWCERAKHDTLELQEKLRLRESCESLAGLYPRAASDLIPELPDQRDIDVIRSSLVGKLASAPGLFDAAVGDSSEDSNQSHSQSDSQDSLNESADSTSSRSKYSYELSEEERQQAGNSDSSEAENDAEEPLRAHDSWNKPLPTAPFIAEMDPFGSDEHKHTDDTEDTVLMASDDEQYYSRDETGSDLEDPQMPALGSAAAVPGRPTGPSDLVLLNTSNPDRPIIWAPAGASNAADAIGQKQRSVAEFAAKDPLMTHQLGMMADRNEIFAKFANIKVSDLDSPAVSADFTQPRSSPFGQMEQKEEDWSRPYVPASTSATAATTKSAEPAYLPSLRNVGELAGLLRSTYRLDISTETGRAAVLERSSSDSSGSDSEMDADDSVIGEDYDNFSAVSIFAAKMMQQQAHQLAAKEAALLRAPSTSTSVAVEASTNTSVVDSTARAAVGVHSPDTEAAALEQEDNFYSAEAIAKRLARFDDSSASALDLAGPEIPTDEMLHDYIMTARFGVDNAAIDEVRRSFTGTMPSASFADKPEAESHAGPKVRFSGAEMRMRMMDELRRQDELFNYTLELAELEKTNALQSARDLAMQAQQRSEKEFAHVKQQQELDLQRLAYENALALSLVNAQAAMDKHAAEQRDQMGQLESQVAAQEMFRQYQDLLRQADHVAGSLEHNQKLLQLEKLMSEESAREAAAQQESKHIAERAALVLAHAESQQAQALTLAAASRSSWQAAEASHAQAAQTHAQAQALAKAQMLALSQLQAQTQHPPKHKVSTSPNRSSRNRLDESTSSAAARYAQDSFEEDYEEEYSTQFEAEASMSMMSKPSKATVGNKRHPFAHNDSVDSIPEDESVTAPAEQHSLSMSDSVHYSPAVKLSRTGQQKHFQHAQLHDSTQSIKSEVSAARPQPRATSTGRVTGATDFDMESSTDSVEEDIPEDHMDETGEVTEESGRSVFESYQDSPVKPAFGRAKAGAMSSSRVSTELGSSTASYSQSRSALEVSERSARPLQQPSRRFHASPQSEDFEVEEEDSRPHDSGSIADEIEEEDMPRQGSYDAGEVEEEEDNDYADEGYDEYSDTFEASGSKGSRSSSLSSKKPAPARHQLVSAAQRTIAAPTSKPAAPRRLADPPRTSIPAYLDSSVDHEGEVLPHTQNVTAVLDEYRAEMEQRLRAQEKTYTLKVQFLRAKQAQRLEWLDKVRQNKKINANDIAEEEQRIRDTYAEERAECERERWALNARSYKELRKFKRLRKELVSYQVNMENSTEAAAEFEAAMLDLKSRKSDLRASRDARRFDVRDSSDSVDSSSDSNAKFGQFKKLGATQAASQVSSVPPTRSAVQHEVDASYADEFEQTFSTSASPAKAQAFSSQAQLKPSSSKFAASYSEVYDDEVLSENEEEKQADDEVLQGSVASEIPEESEASFDDSIEDAPYVSQHDQEGESYRASPVGARDAYDAQGAEFDAYQTKQHQEYSAEEFESTNIESSYKSAALSPDEKHDPSSARTAQQESSSSGSYEEDFVQESHESEESKSNVAASPAPVAVPIQAAVKAVSARKDHDEHSEVSEDEIEEDEELQQSVMSQGSEQYRPDASLSHSQKQELQAFEKAGRLSGSDEFEHDVDRSDSFANSPEKAANLSHHSDSGFDQSHSSPDRDHLLTTKLSTSVHSLGSRSASQQEDLDAVNLGEEASVNEDEYASEFDSEPENDPMEASVSASAHTSPAKTALAPPAQQQHESFQDDESVEEELQSIATEEDAPEGTKEEHSGSDSDLSVQRTDSNSAANSPMKVDTSASNKAGKEDVVKISPATNFSPMRSDRSEGFVGSDDPDVEIWGSEDFAESPSAFSRKTSDLMMQQLSSESMFGSPQNRPSLNSMVFDPDQQRWVGGEEVSLDGFDESIGPADNENDSASHGWRKGEDGRPELIRGTSSESRRSRTDSIEEVDESSFSEDEDDPVSSHSTQSAHSSVGPGQGQEQSVASRLLGQNQPIARLGIAMSAASPFESAATSATNSPLAGRKLVRPTETELVEAPGDAVEDDYGSDFSDDDGPKPIQKTGLTLTQPLTQKDADSASEIESDIEEDIASETSDTSDTSEAELNILPSPVKTAPVAVVEVEPTETVDENNLTALSALSAVDQSDLQSASQLSALLDSAQVAPLDRVDDKLAADELLTSGQETAEGSLENMSFDYIESLGAEDKNVATKQAAKPVTAADDSFLDDLDFGSEASSGEEESHLGITSDATQEADISDFSADFIEPVQHTEVIKPVAPARLDDSDIVLPDYSEELEEIPEMEESESDVEELVVVSEAELSIRSDEEKKEKEKTEQRLVLVEEVTDHLLDVLVQRETQRVLDLVSHSLPASRRQPPAAEAQAKQAPTKQTDHKAEITRDDAKGSAEVDEGEESEQSADLDLLAETLTLSSARFAPKTKDLEPASSLSSLPPLTSMSSLASLSALPSLGGKPRFTPSLTSTEDENEAEDEGDYSIKALVPAEFDDEDLYEFDIPSNANAPAALSLAGPDQGSAESEENQAGAALATALAAAERRQAQCAQIVTETKEFVGVVLDEVSTNLAERLADPHYQGRFVELPLQDEQQMNDKDGGDTPPTGADTLIHKGALTDRINELCEEIFEAKHSTSSSPSTLPFARRLLLQALPLQDTPLRAHILAQVLSEQQGHNLLLQTGDTDVTPQIDSLDTFRQEAQEEITQACNQMADAILARALIETVADLGKYYDMSKLFL